MPALLEGVGDNDDEAVGVTQMERHWGRFHSAAIGSFEQLVRVGGAVADDGLHSTNWLRHGHTATSEVASDVAVNRFVRLEKKVPAHDLRTRFVALQEWEGRVTSIDEEAGTFQAALIDLTANALVEGEEATFLLSDVQDYERGLVAEGAYFRWVIGHRYIGRTRERTSRVVFRRLPAWSSTDLQKAREEAEALAALIRRR